MIYTFFMVRHSINELKFKNETFKSYLPQKSQSHLWKLPKLPSRAQNWPLRADSPGQPHRATSQMAKSLRNYATAAQYQRCWTQTWTKLSATVRSSPPDSAGQLDGSNQEGRWWTTPDQPLFSSPTHTASWWKHLKCLRIETRQQKFSPTLPSCWNYWHSEPFPSASQVCELFPRTSASLWPVSAFPFRSSAAPFPAMSDPWSSAWWPCRRVRTSCGFSKSRQPVCWRPSGMDSTRSPKLGFGPIPGSSYGSLRWGCAEAGAWCPWRAWPRTVGGRDCHFRLLRFLVCQLGTPETILEIKIIHLYRLIMPKSITN